MYESHVDAAVSNAATLISHLDDSKLNELLDDDEKIEELIRELSNFKSLQAEKQSLVSENKVLAQKNLSFEERLRTSKDTLLQAYDEAVRAKEEFQAKKTQLDDLSDNKSLDTTLALLQTAVAEAEEESEKLKNEFLEQSEGPSVDAFIEEYTKARRKFHVRRVKAEKMAAMMQTRGGGGGSGGVGSGFVPRRPAPPVPPYPMPGSAGMRMPGGWNYSTTM